jgi:HPt (histidine-containing phosphotransfer) domain-containing protein
MLKSEQLEREAEARRAQLEETFEELRGRVTPGHVLDQLVDYATDSGGTDFFRNLRDQTVANPLALGMVGAGLAWLMLSNGKETRRRYGYGTPYRSRRRSYFADARERAESAAGEAGAPDRVTEAAHRASEAAGSIGVTARTAKDAALETASQWREAAGSAASSVRDATSSTYEQAKSRVSDTKAAFGGAASALYGGVAHSAGRTTAGMKTFARGAAITSQDMLDFCRDQPLVLAGLGIALGAAVGAALPSTETEDQLTGDVSDEIKEQTRALAKEQYEKSKSTAEAVIDEVQHKVRDSAQPLTAQPSIVPSGSEGEISETEDPVRSEAIGLHNGRS